MEYAHAPYVHQYYADGVPPYAHTVYYADGVPPYAHTV